MGSGAAWDMVAVAAAADSVMEAAATAGLGTVQAVVAVDTVAAGTAAAATVVVDMVVVDMVVVDMVVVDAGAMVEAAITDRTDRSARRRGSTVMTRASALVCAAAFACLVSGCASHRKRADVDQPRQVCEATMIGSQPKTVCY